MQAVDTDVVGVHAEVVGVQYFTVTNPNLVAVPQRFLCIGEAAIAQVDALHPAEHLRGIHEAVDELAVSAVPEGRARRRFEVAIVDKEIAALPKDVLALEGAVVCLNVSAFFDARFAEMYRYTLKPCIVKFVKRTLAAVFFVLN